MDWQFWKWERQFWRSDRYRPPNANSRGVIRRVDEVVSRGFMRSQVKALPEILGPDKGTGEFQSLQYLPGRLRLPVLMGVSNLYRTVLRLTGGEPIYLVVHGGRWDEGDPIPMEKIVYRYEP